MKPQKKIEIVYLKVSNLRLKFADENPNHQEDDTFNDLVESIREHGFIDPLDVVPSGKDGFCDVIGGEHRFKAAELLGLEEVPCIVHRDFDDDTQEAMLVKLNVIKGKIQPERFLKLYQKLAKKYPANVVQKMMGIANNDSFKKLVAQVQNNVPKEIKDKLKDKLEDVQNVDDLANILNILFRTHGNTLDHSYMVFDYSGKKHVWVKMNTEMANVMEKVKAFCQGQNVNINDVLLKALSDPNFIDYLHPKKEQSVN